MKRKSPLNDHSTLLLVVQIVVLLIGALFFAGGCPNEPDEGTGETTEAAFKKFTGKWIVTYSSDSQDSSFINSAWIDLRADSTFSSNTSFFWKEYAQNIQPLQGRWWTTRDASSRMLIQLTIEQSYKSWGIEGNGTRDSTMVWADQNPYAVRYRWKIY